MSLADIGVRVLRPFARSIDARTLGAVVHDALDFDIPLVNVEPGIYALELFHGPTLAFKDVGARVMARLMATLGGDVTVLTATSADSINVGRLLPQMIYYFHAIAELKRRAGDVPRPIVCTPSGNFGNLTAGLMAKRAGAPIARFIAATNVNDVVPQYLISGRFEPRASLHTIANAMDVGNPSNFERMLWLYGGDADALRKDISGSVHEDVEVKAAIKDVFDRTGYLLDPHSAIGYLGLTRRAGQERQERREGI